MIKNLVIQNGKAVMPLGSRFDFKCFYEFRDLCRELVSNKQINVIELDFHSVDYMDSSALGMLLMLRDRAEAVGKRVLLANCHGNPRKILDIASFSQLFDIN